jgi:hypothetical protein
MPEGQSWPNPIFDIASISQIWPPQLADRHGQWPPNGHRLCQGRQDIAALATGFGPKVPEMARAEPGNCQLQGNQALILRRKFNSKLGKILPRSATITDQVQQRNAPTLSANTWLKSNGLHMSKQFQKNMHLACLVLRRKQVKIAGLRFINDDASS